MGEGVSSAVAADQHEQDERRHLHQGFGAALNNAFEIAMVPLVFAGLGWLLDRALGTGWVMTAVFAMIGLLGTFAKLYYRYNAQMLRLEESGSWKTAPKAPR
jgi:F0F1-type ATP synthase assembly protein I